ncbi:MAG: hypothetical protein NVSMB26_24230 [Beijerinckiaceae bacterium]
MAGENWYYYACGGTCNGPVRIQSGNRVQADQLADNECDCEGCCRYLGCTGINCNGDFEVTHEQANFSPSPELITKARTVYAVK